MFKGLMFNEGLTNHIFDKLTFFYHPNNKNDQTTKIT